MCSACMTIAPSASNSAVDASRRSLMLAEWAERTSTAPISSQAARSAPSITCRVTGPMPLTTRAPGSRRRRRPRRSSREAPPASSPRARTTAGPASRASPGPSTRASSSSPAITTRRVPRSSAVAAALGRGSGAGRGRGDAHGHQLELGIVVAVAVAGLVGLVELASQVVRRRVRRGLDRELEGLAGVAQLVGRAQLRVRVAQLVAGPRRQPVERRGDGSPASAPSPPSSTLSTTSRRCSESTSPSADSTPPVFGHDHAAHLELVGDLGGVERPGAPERHQREVARVDPALDRDHAHRRGHLAVRDPHDPQRGIDHVQVELSRQRGHGPLGRSAVQRHVAGQRRPVRRGGPAAGWRP